jgi:Nucleoside 2-deoxyribosyltransferase
MRTCFVIQPFDKGEFDKRYDDVFDPAIKKAGLEPYRVDRDPSASIPIEAIEKNIQDADVCLADISMENPNVWFEVGYAIASGKEVVLVCKEGSTFPFDVRHRLIITYTTHSMRDFQKLQADSVGRLDAIKNKNKLISAMSPVKPTHGLTAPETLALALIMEDRVTPNPGLMPHNIAADMEKGGFTRMATALALEGLREKSLVDLVTQQDYNEPYNVYVMTPNGIKWCMENQSQFQLTVAPGTVSRSQNAPQAEEEDDDIPF